MPMTWDGDAVAAAIEAAAVRGLRQAAELVYERADALVPVDDGELRDSGHVHVDEDALTAKISYGGEGLPQAYVARQHEDLNLHHRDGRGAKWLERAANASRGEIPEIIADAVRQALR